MSERPTEYDAYWNPSPEELRRRDVRRRTFWLKEWGIRVPAWGNESKAPPVDLELLGALRDGKLDKETRVRLTRLILSFHSWTSAYCHLGLERRENGRKHH